MRQTEELAQPGVCLIGLGALGYDARPSYNRATGKRLRKVGMDIPCVYAGEAGRVQGSHHSGVRAAHPVANSPCATAALP